jgi:hypothetical protein
VRGKLLFAQISKDLKKLVVVMKFGAFLLPIFQLEKVFLLPIFQTEKAFLLRIFQPANFVATYGKPDKPVVMARLGS